jgi:YHYH protein/Fibronectin type III domain
MIDSTSGRTAARQLSRTLTVALAAAFLSACGGGGDTAAAPAPSPTAPGAPIIATATAGDGSTSITFAAPATDGGSAITGYTASCSASGTSQSASGSASPVTVTGLVNGTAYACSVIASNAVGASAASAVLSVTPAAPAGGASGSTAGVLCGISGSEFNSSASVNLTATFSWTCTASSRVLTANGVPNHPVGTFPGPGNPNTLAAVATSATYTLLPATQAAPTTVVTSGYGLNGIKMEPATAGTCSGATGTTCNLAGGGGTWTIEALGQTAFNFGVDTSNAHVQPNGSYHYHGMPEGLINKLGGDASTMTLVGWAPDGFPIYARNGYASASDSSSGLRALTSSWRLKTSADASRPSTASYPMGTFTQDYEYVAGLGDLDECNGRTGVTPEFPSGTYYYAITTTFPFIGRCVRGTPASIR